MPHKTNDNRIHRASGRPVVDTDRRTHVGQVIRKYRIAAGMDKAALAAQLGYTKTAVGNWELGLPARTSIMCRGSARYWAFR